MIIHELTDINVGIQFFFQMHIVTKKKHTYVIIKHRLNKNSEKYNFTFSFAYVLPFFFSELQFER